MSVILLHKLQLNRSFPDNWKSRAFVSRSFSPSIPRSPFWKASLEWAHENINKWRRRMKRDAELF